MTKNTIPKSPIPKSPNPKSPNPIVNTEIEPSLILEEATFSRHSTGAIPYISMQTTISPSVTHTVGRAPLQKSSANISSYTESFYEEVRDITGCDEQECGVFSPPNRQTDICC
ncbi:hypothetical protein JCM33374_g860 [Metschnikowia sp. JCM 33374]|nr:hypothetical protein JCM33374_g860 [Metschnikowia sp. JCM 33374]